MAIDYATYSTPRLDLGVAFQEYQLSADTFIGNGVFAPFSVPKKAGSFSRITRESMLRTANVKRAPNAHYGRDEFEAEDATWTCVERGHEVVLDLGEVARFAGDFNSEFQATQHAMTRIMLDQEVDIANAVFDGTTNFTTSNGLRTDVGTSWATASTDIMADVFAAKEAVRGRTGIDPDTFIIGAVDLNDLLNNDNIRASLQYVRQADYTVVLDALGSLFGLPKVLIGRGVYNGAKEGQTYSQTNIWGTGWAMICKTANPGDSLSQPCMGRNLYWTSAVPGETTVEMYAEPQTNSMVYRARSFADELMIDTAFGQLLDTAA